MFTGVRPQLQQQGEIVRLIVLIVSLALLGAAALAGQSLWHTLTATPGARDAIAVSSDEQAAEYQTSTRSTRIWPAVFGDVVREEPQPPAPPQPPTPPTTAAPPTPPIGSLGYVLQGVVRAGDSEWAIVSHPTGQRILRVGDLLQDGISIVSMDETGLTVTQNGQEAILAFPD